MISLILTGYVQYVPFTYNGHHIFCTIRRYLSAIKYILYLKVEDQSHGTDIRLYTMQEYYHPLRKLNKL